MMENNEKIIYQNNNGERISISYSFPFFFQKIDGVDGINSNLTSIKSVNQDGCTIINTTLSARNLTIFGALKAESKTEMGSFRSKLLKIFNPKVKGILIYEYGDIKRKINCQVETAPKFIKMSSSYKYQKFKIELICPNPYWQDVNKMKKEIAIWRSSLEFPLELLKEGKEVGFREQNLILNIENNGDVPCGIEIEFKDLATVINPSIFNINTREYFKINKVMSTGEIITINTQFQNKKVFIEKDGIVENGFNYIDINSTFLQLDIGNNIFRSGADKGLDNLEISVFYRNNYLGV